MVTNGHNLAFGEFIEHLRRQGFTVGVDHYLRLQQLLDRLGGDCAPADLKTILCPIFATNNAQQEQFYHAFDSYYAIFQVARAPELAEIETPEQQTPAFEEAKPAVKRKRFAIIAAPAAILVIVLVASILYFMGKPQEGNIGPVQEQQGQAEPAEPPTEPAQPPPDVQAVEAAPEPAAPEPELSFEERYGDWIRMAVVFLPLVIFAVYEWRRYRQRKLALQKQRRKRPPYTWPVRIESSPARLYDSESFYTAARLLRQRQVDEFHRLDVDATVAATIESLGYPTFCYKPYSKPPEYLALIDRASLRDHQARLFGELSQALEQEGVFVSRYFYEGDPRVCSEPSGGYVQMAELQRKHAGHRLLIFGNGDKLIDPVTGKLAAWTHLFQDWQERALLTPEVPARWGLREINLAGEFVVLPATLAGLLAVVDHFESPGTADLRSWLEDSDAPPRTAEFAALVESLRSYLGEEAFQWLCACAVYPELHWDLTLYLGSLERMGDGLISEESLLRLIRLPWFRSGAMPDELRWLLIGQLDREKEKAIRRAIIEMLEHNPPPQGSFADDVYQLHLALQRWLYAGNRKKRREMVRVIRSMPRGQAARDYTLVRFLASARRSPLDTLLPGRLRKLFYRNGLSVFGLKTGARLCVALAVSTIALWIYLADRAPAPTTPDMPPTETPITTTSVTPPPGMVYVPGDTFTMGFNGSVEVSERPEHERIVDAFFIDQYEVTLMEYYIFIKTKNRRLPRDWPQKWKDGNFSVQEGKLPVTSVTWQDARAYAASVGRRLPTEVEWEYAARGTDERLYPWGKDFNPNYANVEESGIGVLRPVGGYPNHTSPFQVFDMAGNAAEWTESDPLPYPGSEFEAKPGKIVRGGSYFTDKIYARTTSRAWLLPDDSRPYLGFRCAMDATIIAPKETQPPVIAQTSNTNSSSVRVIRNTNKNSPPTQNANTRPPDSSSIETDGGPTSTTGVAQGRVTDPQGVGISGAIVTVTHEATGLKRSVQTKESGDFFLAVLPPGIYTITASKSGYIDAKTGGFPIRFAKFNMLKSALILRPVGSDPKQSPPAPKIIRKSGGVLVNEAVERAQPAYPPEAEKARISGAVVVELVIDEQGNVISAKPLSGHPLLRDAAVEAARKWKFKPTFLDGQPVKVIGTITFNFTP